LPLKDADSAHQMPFNVGDRVNFSENSASCVPMDRVAQIRKSPRRRNDREGGDTTRPDKLLKGSGDRLGKTMLFEFMPVCRLHSAASGAACTCKAASWAIGALLVCGGILIDQNTFGSQVWKFRIAFVAQEKRFPSIADEDVSVVGNSELVHDRLR
jgi:hypothetical protein